ncbi:ethanolaminephosphotransferase 1-like [Paramacrobiotus metropolitanus]|uniref:ethanolaminephosphotransferase 1-like n=1 Tax=Paramacrobiotus metropolitanus TaxID=2943436 RepID=UPI002445A0A0|nr:ethanolaminephosphotransferase 1-like [Paramacrobiotus metropolitanus]
MLHSRSASHLKDHASSLFPSASEEQLDGFLHIKYEMLDTSPISHFILRPYWRVVSSRMPNFPPGILIFSGLSIIILNVVILTFCDPAFDSHTVPVGIWLLCGVFHWVSLTCAGVDAAGRLTRREDLSQSAYLSMEYIDQAMDSVSIPIKIICLFHLTGVNANKTGLFSHHTAFLFFLCILGLSLCRQWRNYNTGIFRSSALFDGLDVGLCVGFFLKALTAIYSGYAPGDLPEWMHTILATMILGLMVYIIRTTFRLAGDISLSDIVTNRTPVIPFIVISAVQYFWLSPDYPAVFPYICWSTTVVYSHIVSRWILNQMSDKPETQWNVMGVLVLLTGILHMCGYIPPDLRVRCAAAVCIVCTVWQTIYGICILNALLYRVLLAIFEAFFRHAATWMVSLFGKTTKSAK